MSGNGDNELRDALIDSYKALTAAGVDSLVVGGVVISYYLEGEAKIDHDIDLFIREDDVEQAMDAIAAAGFEMTRTHPTWLFKGRRNGATVDVLYRLGRILKLDDEMIERAVEETLDGLSLPLISREDLAIAQAGAASSEVPGHWFEAVDLLQSTDLLKSGDIDWDYLVRRGATAPDLTIALLHYARHAGIDVPVEALTATLST